VREFFRAAAQNQGIADEFVDSFNNPPRLWEILGSPEGVARALRKHQSAPLAERVTV
jgi:hypothetical protein